MNILKVRFENINSLKGAHEINFKEAPLAGSGIFAITGPTGSGKTTILDVISLALFNQIPRVSSKITKNLIEKTGLIVTRNTGKAMAEVTYSCHSGVYISKWSIDSTRNNTFRDYELELFDETDNKLDIRKTLVPEKNAELIGLNFDQFVKAILLAQGDFSAFLKAKADERGKLLEKVTGTDIYRRLGIAAYQKNREQREAHERLMDQSRQLEGQLLSQEAFETLQQDIAVMDQEITRLSELITAIKSQEKLKTDITDLSGVIDGIKNQQEEQQLALDAFREAHGHEMERHRELVPFRQDFWNWQQLQQTLETQKTRLDVIATELRLCADEDAAVKKEVKDLTGSELAVDEALNEFQEKVLDLRGKRDQANTLRMNTGEEVLREARRNRIVLPTMVAGTAEKTLKEHLEKKQDELNSLAEQLDAESMEDPAKTIEELDGTIEIVRSLITGTANLGGKKEDHKKKQSELNTLQDEVSQLPAKIEKTRLMQEKAVLVLQGLQKDKNIRDLSATLEEHRSKLVEGQPCPLCGALEHPYSLGLPAADDDLDHKIKTASDENEKLKQDLSQQNTSLDLKLELLEKRKPELTALEEQITKLEAEVLELKETLPATLRETEPAELLGELRTKAGKIRQYSQFAEEAGKLKILVEKAGTWKNHESEYFRQAEALNAVFPGENVLNVTGQLSRRYNSNIQRQKSLTEERTTLEQAFGTGKQEFKQLTEQLLTALPAFETVEIAIAGLMKDQDFDRLVSQEGAINEAIKDLTAQLKVHRENLAGMQKRDVDDTPEELQEKREAHVKTHGEIKEQRDTLVGQRDFQVRTIQQLAVLQEQIEAQRQQNEKWVLLKNYIGDAEGKRFSTFAQELTLFQLTRLANKRLEMLSDRYKLDIPAQDEDDSLVVVDTHMGDMRRSVKSLSGGESFLVSLSLALALSDMAARKVEIGSLFIDEGFGSLDKLTLDQTIDTLEKLQYTSKKTIGVISHVEAMQERITTQIRLEKSGQGHSRLTVV